MNKIIPSLSFAIGVLQVDAGSFARRNMYSPYDFAQGVGMSREAALKDAATAIPANFARDFDNSPAVDCVDSAPARESNIMKCTVAGDKFIATIPVVKR